MATIYVRDVPEDVTAVLKRRAADEGKSFSAYLAGELARLAARPSNQEIVARLRASDRSHGPSTDDIVRELGAGRR
ncbi:MAG TPA: antitoxin [Dermatophilaceae bacterium]|nr:antitoxin [Dermatophilaceae bacterium]